MNAASVASISNSTASTTTGARIYQFPNTKPTETRESITDIDAIISNTVFRVYLSDYIESIVVNTIETNYALQQLTRENPFDAIYLSDLMPDEVNHNNLNLIKLLADRIIDKSDTIEFNDGWDD